MVIIINTIISQLNNTQHKYKKEMEKKDTNRSLIWYPPNLFIKSFVVSEKKIQ